MLLSLNHSVLAVSAMFSEHASYEQNGSRRTFVLILPWLLWLHSRLLIACIKSIRDVLLQAENNLVLFRAIEFSAQHSWPRHQYAC